MTFWLLLILFDLLVVWGFTRWDATHPSYGTSGNLGVAILLAFTLGLLNLLAGIVSIAWWALG